MRIIINPQWQFYFFRKRFVAWEMHAVKYKVKPQNWKRWVTWMVLWHLHISNTRKYIYDLIRLIHYSVFGTIPYSYEWDLLSACSHRQFHTLPGLLDSRAALMHCVPCRGAVCSIFMMVFGMTRPGGELRTYCVRGGHANHEANPTR